MFPLSRRILHPFSFGCIFSVLFPFFYLDKLKTKSVCDSIWNLCKLLSFPSTQGYQITKRFSRKKYIFENSSNNLHTHIHICMCIPGNMFSDKTLKLKLYLKSPNIYLLFMNWGDLLTPLVSCHVKSVWRISLIVFLRLRFSFVTVFSPCVFQFSISHVFTFLAFVKICFRYFLFSSFLPPQNLATTVLTFYFFI